MSRNRRILVVDDDPGVRDSYEQILRGSTVSGVAERAAALFNGQESGGESQENCAYELLLVEGGVDAIRVVREAMRQGIPYAMAFVDMMMVGIDGAETARRMRAIDPNMRIVIVTAYSERTPDDIARIVGSDDIFYLRKPFDPQEIRQFAKALTGQWNLARERDTATAQLEGLNDELEDRVEQRSAELRQAYEKLNRLDQDKMKFLHYLSHELNTPLNWIGSGVSLIESPTGKEAELLECVSMGFDRLSNLVRTVISYFDVAGGTLRPTLECVPLEGMISEVLATKKTAIDDARLDLICDARTEEHIDVEPEYFKELLGILLDNATAFSEPGGRIAVTVQSDGRKVIVIVADEGRGSQFVLEMARAYYSSEQRLHPRDEGEEATA